MIKEADDTDLLPHTIAIHEFWNVPKTWQEKGRREMRVRFSWENMK